MKSSEQAETETESETDTEADIETDTARCTDLLAEVNALISL